MNKVRTFLQGKKTYITAAIGLLGALAAWADGQIDTVALLASVWAAAQAIFIRAGIASEVAKSQE
jgi:small-conductance mechanosensitive channel